MKYVYTASTRIACCYTVWVVFVLSGIGAAGAVGPQTAACPPVPAPEAATRNVAIVVDESAFRPAAFVDQLRVRVGDIADYGVRVVIYRFAGENPLPAIVDDVMLPQLPGDESLSNWEPVTLLRAKQKCAKQALVAGRERIQAAVASVARNLHDDANGTSPILAALRQVSQAFAGRTLRIILLSDGIEHSSVASLYASRVAGRDPADVLNSTEASGFLGATQHATLQIAGLALQAPEQAAVRPGANLSWLTRFWSLYGKRTGMTVTEVSSSAPVSVR